MSFPALILEFLKKNRRLSVSGFGELYLKSTNAVVETDGNTILPPATEIAFDSRSGEADLAFAKFLADEKKISTAEAEAEIKKQVAFWTSILEKEGRMVVEELGTFYLNDSSISLAGIRLTQASPDFYGLEEINIAKIGRRQKSQDHQKPYAISRSIYWILALVLTLCAITYLGISEPELLFGNKSILDPRAKSTTVTNLNTSIAPKTEIAVITADSAKTDTLPAISAEEAAVFK